MEGTIRQRSEPRHTPRCIRVAGSSVFVAMKCQQAVRLPAVLIGALVILNACGADDPGLREELRNKSAANGLALAGASGNSIIVIPFDVDARYFESDYASVAFGKAGRVVLWWNRRDFFDFSGEFVIESIDGKQITAVRPPTGGFHAAGLSENASRLAFLGTLRGKNAPRGLYWASFDFSSSGLVDPEAGYPDWSPGGGALVYEKEGHIYLFDVSSSSSKPLVSGQYPTWSPNGKLIAFVAPDGRASLVTTEGVPTSWPLNTHRPISPLRWSPDGRYVSFSEALPSAFGLVDAASHLLVCRVSDGKTITVRTFNSEAVNFQAFQWIVEYRKFCGRCRERPK